jgi:hypothetical protein
MKKSNGRAARRLRGSTSLFLLMGMIPMMGIVALALELGNVTVHQRRLQNYVDSKAIAALKQQFGGAPEIELYQFVDGEEVDGGSTFDVHANPVKGVWNFNTSGAAFSAVTTSPPPLSAGQVPAFQFEVDPFEVPLIWGPLFNVASVDIRAEAVAFAPRREVVIVQDVSGSMCRLPDGSFLPIPCSAGARIGPAKNADIQLVNEMASQEIPGDMMGIVAFNDGIVDTQELISLNAVSTLTAFINGLEGAGNTDVGGGIREGNTLFSGTTPDLEIARIMIIVGDGRGGDGAPEAADAAENLGADVYTIAFCNGANCDDAEDFLSGLRRGEGTFSAAPDGPALSQLLTDIVTGVSMKLVR